MSPTDLSTYLADRDDLINQDRALRVDSVKRGNLSATEAAADEIVRAIRAEEASSVWGAAHEEVEHPFLGMEFLTSRSVIMKTKVFHLLHKARSTCSHTHTYNEFILTSRVVRLFILQMPKGALLHAHLDATVDIHFLLKRVLEQDAMYVRASTPLTTLSPTANVLPEFSPLPKSEVKLSPVLSLTDPSYGGGWIPVNVAREAFSQKLGGPEGFDKWYVSSTTINPAEAYGTHRTVNKVPPPCGTSLEAICDGPFFVDLGKIPGNVRCYQGEAVTSHPLPRVCIQGGREVGHHQVLSDLSGVCQGVFVVFHRGWYFVCGSQSQLFVQVRLGVHLFPHPLIRIFYRTFFGPDGRNTLTHRDMLEIYGSVVQDVKDEMRRQGREDEFVGSRVHYLSRSSYAYPIR